MLFLIQSAKSSDSLHTSKSLMINAACNDNLGGGLRKILGQIITLLLKIDQG